MKISSDSFFRSIRGYFKSEYSGRYLSVILRELAEHEPESFALLLRHLSTTAEQPIWGDIGKLIAGGEANVECEVSFQGARKMRKADLAIMQGGAPLVLMEVKEFDHLKDNPDQLSDYLRSASPKLGFIYIYRFLPSGDELSEITMKIDRGWPVALLSYDQIYKTLKDSKDHGRALGALLCHYLEDIGVGIYREIQAQDRNALAFLLAQMLGFPDRAGMGKLQSEATVQRGPPLVATLLANMEVVGEWAREPNEKVMRTHCNTRFWIDPWLNHKRVRIALKETGNDPGRLPGGLWRDYVKGGCVYFVAAIGVRSSKMQKNDYLNMNLGLGAELRTGDKKKTIKWSAYCNFFGSDFDEDDTYEDTNYFTKFPKEQEAFEKFRSCIEGSLSKAIKLATGPRKAALKQIRIPH